MRTNKQAKVCCWFIFITYSAILLFHVYILFIILTRKGLYNRGNKLSGQMRKTALCLTPQAMYNQFKRPSAASVSELYYICRKT